MNSNEILADTSAWIASFKRKGSEALKTFLKEAIDRDELVTTPIVVLELLQGCGTEEEMADLKAKLESLDQCSMEDLSWERAYRFAFSLRRRGLTVPTVDILIAFLCIEKRCTLLHHDRHFKMIAKHSDLVAIDFLGA